ncbi:MAG: ArsR/SmtB family transcription factor [Pikeienuella sp.]
MEQQAALKTNAVGSFTLGIPVFDDGLSDAEIDGMVENARQATNFMKALAHEGRLMLLCHLASGEKSVTELEDLLSARQAAVSQQLARLRLEGLVEFRRDGKAMYYRLKDPRAKRMIETVYDMFCNTDEAAS